MQAKEGPTTEWLRMMWSANAIWATTGYGIQGKYLLPRLAAKGIAAANFAWYGLAGAKIQAGAITMYPAMRDPWGCDVIGAHCADFHADVVVSLQDLWVLPAGYKERFRAKWAPWFPVDHQPIPPLVLERAKEADYPLVYSRFGYEECARAGLETTYIPHGVDPTVFCPGDKAAARERLGIPADCYLVDIVAANKGNPSRKALPENILAFAKFRKSHPDAMLYLHTEMGAGNDGIELRAFMEAIGLDAKCVIPAPQYRYLMGLPDTYMADVYRASDVHLAAATSEGFGIPILEAQACGTPVITTNFTAMPELTWAGITVEPRPTRTWTPLNSWIAQVDPDAVAEALEEVYGWGDKGQSRKCQHAVKVAHEQYGWDVLVDGFWVPFLRGVAHDIADAEHAPEPRTLYAAFYDQVAERDHSMCRTDADHWYNAHRRQVALEAIGSRRYETVVDLGCAEGEMVQTLVDEYIGLGLTVDAVDISQVRIAEAADTLPAQVTCIVANAETYGESGAYDLVLAMELIEHVVDPEALLANIRRMLATNGVALITTPNDPDGAFVDGCEHLRGYGFSSLVAACQKAGLAVDRAVSTVPGIYGPEGLLAHPERLAAYQERVRWHDWALGEGQNIYLVAHKAEEPQATEDVVP